MAFGQKSSSTKNCCSNIRDIVDGTEYKKFKQNGAFLNNEDHLTLLFNTDGIPLYKSSKININYGQFFSPSMNFPQKNGLPKEI